MNRKNTTSTNMVNAMQLIMKRTTALFIMLALALVFSYQAIAAPVGGTLTNYSTDSGPTLTVPTRTDDRGTITTVLFDSAQQNQNWKAYVGNVSGGVALRDSSSNTIYDWSLTTIAGEVYASNVSADFSGTGALDCTILAADYAANNAYFDMVQGAGDSINATFNDTAHAAFTVGAHPETAADTCPSIALWNGASQPASSTADFQEVIFQEAAGAFVYTAFLNDDTTGFDGNTYDFEMIIPESDEDAANTYYFYVELTV